MIQRIIDMRFRNAKVLTRVFTRDSLTGSTDTRLGRKTLQFLGDSIIQFIVADYLCKELHMDAGRMTKLRASLVGNRRLAEIIRTIGLRKFIMSSGEKGEGERIRDKPLADTFEALVGAMYLDRGLKPTGQFVRRMLLSDARERLVGKLRDPKSELQERIQAREKIVPEYRILDESGPDHSKIFRVGVFVDGKQLGVGEGKSKKEAEEIAARRALENNS